MFKSNKLLNNMTIGIFVIVLFLRSAAGFMCFKCSYSLWSAGSTTNCIDDPSSLGNGDRLYCNSTSYCVFSERFRLRDSTIVSYFRTCSGVPWGDTCTPSQSHLTCMGSCQGDYCNRDAKGDMHVGYLERHKGHLFENSAATFDKRTLQLVMCMALVLLVL